MDYGFRINGIPKFFLEAKALEEDLDKPEFIKQAINYSWHKGCTWAILTNFRRISIYNAEWKTPSLFQNHFKTITCEQFADNFDELWLLSKEAFKPGFHKVVRHGKEYFDNKLRMKVYTAAIKEAGLNPHLLRHARLSWLAHTKKKALENVDRLLLVKSVADFTRFDSAESYVRNMNLKQIKEAL